MRPVPVLLFAVLLFALPAAPPARAQSDEIRGVIADQLAAFRADDFATAFGYASPNIRDIFGDAQNFGRMVRTGYPMVWRPASVRFGRLETVDGRLYQTVWFTDAAGQLFEAAYEMVRTDQGWRINGVYLREADSGV